MTRKFSATSPSASQVEVPVACVEFAPELGRHRVYQLSGPDGEKDDGRSFAFTARGRTLIRSGRGFDALTSDWWRGWRFRRTTLSAEYPLERFLADLQPNLERSRTTACSHVDLLNVAFVAFSSCTRVGTNTTA